MRLRRLLRKLKVSLAGLVGGLTFACSGPNPGEMPPMAPRPEPVQPMPSAPSKKLPLPGAPDPIAPDAGSPATEVPSPAFRSSQEVPDAGSDAMDMPPILDALPPDANKQPETAQAFNCC